MKNVEIEVFPIAHTRVMPEYVDEWLQRLEVSGDTINSYLDQEDTSEPALLIALAAKRCYNSFEVGHNPNITKVRKDLTEYIDNILASGHGSVLEHSTYSFAIEGVSRVFTGEMNRHRVGTAISEASMRYIRFDDIPFWMPNSIRLTEKELGELEYLAEKEGVELPYLSMYDKVGNIELLYKKWKSQEVFKRAFKQDEDNYKKLLEIWKDELAPESKFHLKKQVTSMMRRIIGMGVATGGVWTLNIRALRHVIAMRASEAAEEEICAVAVKMAEWMTNNEGMLFADLQRIEFETGLTVYIPKYKKV